MSLFAELKRRNVFRVAIFYIVSAWLVLQIADLIFEVLLVPDWTLRFMFGALVAAFPFVLFFAWAFELTPEGIKRESEVDRSASATPETGRKLNLLTSALIVAGIAFLVIDRYVLETPATDATAPNVSAETATRPVADVDPVPPALVEPDRASVAVLPFADLSPEQDQQYFSDGIAEEILNVLVRIEDLKVASRTSAFAFRGTSSSIPEIAASLGVRHVLEGSVRKAGDRIRVTAQLIDATDDSHVWSETFDRDLTDVFAVQDEIARAVYSALLTAFGREDAEAPGSLIEASTENLDAYQLFLEGRALFYTRDRLLDAVELLEQAVAIDPDFARAWEMLAAVYSIAPGWGLADWDEFLDKADAAAEEALRLDPELYFAMAVQAQAEFNRPVVDWDRVMALLDQSLAGNPNDPSTWLWLAIAQRFLGNLEEAGESIRQCLRVDPAYENCRNHQLYLALETGANEFYTRWLDRTLTETDVRYYFLFPHLAPMFARQGDRRTALLLIAARAGWMGSPGAKLWIDGLLSPAQDRPAFARQIEAIEGETNHVVVSLTLGDYEMLEPSWGLRQSMWRSDVPEFRQTQQFHDLIEAMGIGTYWREHGLPPQCRTVEERFACD